MNAELLRADRGEISPHLQRDAWPWPKDPGVNRAIDNFPRYGSRGTFCGRSAKRLPAYLQPAADPSPGAHPRRMSDRGLRYPYQLRLLGFRSRRIISYYDPFPRVGCAAPKNYINEQTALCKYSHFVDIQNLNLGPHPVLRPSLLHKFFHFVPLLLRDGFQIGTQLFCKPFSPIPNRVDTFCTSFVNWFLSLFDYIIYHDYQDVKQKMQKISFFLKKV
jgi:hypothetical protein